MDNTNKINQNLIVLIYIFLSVMFSTFWGDYLKMDIPLFSEALDFIAEIVPSISILESNSDFPLLTRRFLSLMWALTPLFIYGMLMVKKCVVINKNSLSRRPMLYFFLLIMLLVLCFSFLFCIISIDVAAGAPRDKMDDLVLMRKSLYLINRNRFALGLIVGSFFSLQALVAAYLIVVSNQLIKR